MNKTRRPIVAGNWKMNGTRASATSLLTALKQSLGDCALADVIVFPPAILLEQTQRILADSAINWGGQNLALAESGAFTGEISGAMLADFGCRYVLVGHSERRALYGENNEVVAKKFALAQAAGLTPVLCVGETLQQRDDGGTQDVVGYQLAQVLDRNGGVDALNNAIIAYEPVWAIGTGLTATPEQAQEVHAALRAQVAKQNASIAERVRILYGGSAKASNAKALFSMPDIDGGLIGGASLDAQEFIEIYQSLK